MPDASVAPGSGSLLLSEIQSVGGAAELIEIVNLTNRAVDLRRYYLTDFIDYWRFPSGGMSAISGDFLVGFPTPAFLEPGAVLTVALQAAEFAAGYGQGADYAVDITTDVDRTRAFGSRLVAGTPTLADSGEVITLFYWDGVSDRVRDVDLVVAGLLTSLSPVNRLLPKEPVDGPDAGTTASPYAADNGLFGGGVMTSSPLGTSYKRLFVEVGRETQVGTGNGLTGDDETSEVLHSTWEGSSPHSAPTPGRLPVSLLY